jgi:hypothetical protein
MGVGSSSNFSGAVHWQDSCPNNSYVSGYKLNLWLPPDRNDSAAITLLALSCSGFTNVTEDALSYDSRDYYPPFAEFLPLSGNDSSASILGTGSNLNSSETWLPWQESSTYLLCRISASGVLTTHTNAFAVFTRVCPAGSYLSRVQVASASNRVVAFNASCADALTGAPTVQYDNRGSSLVKGAVVSVDAKRATAVNVGCSNTTAGPVLASLSGVGEAAFGASARQMSCPLGQILDGYQLVGDSINPSILAIRFHCSLVAGLVTSDPLPGTSTLFPATRESSNSTNSEVEAQIVDVINIRRRRSGVGNLTMGAAETCAALNISSTFGNTSAPKYCSPNLHNEMTRNLTNAYLDQV